MTGHDLLMAADCTYHHIYAAFYTIFHHLFHYHGGCSQCVMKQILHLKLYFYVVLFVKKEIIVPEELDDLSNTCGLQRSLWNDAKQDLKQRTALYFSLIMVVCLSFVLGLLFFPVSHLLPIY